ncbi:MAG TPA: hypothetical protein VND90_11580 [Terracidiphilus sp.]|nr:hypothetical protein [Terracidiphilus sp.]
MMLRAFWALLAGFAAVMAVVLGVRGLLLWLAPGMAEMEQHPGTGFTVVNVGSSLLAGTAGGYVTAMVGRANPMVHVLALGIAVLALSALSALQSHGKQPIWYQLVQVAISPLGVLAGGLLRLRVLGIL